ncbi:MAG: SpaH/EbpB family LPXTG-anchored major pilin [Micropruina sp.]|uniref:SpaH/EbpB family LPXTG-anchored major pilin n=1 Tax=Micropruina sp. TaxID=2737536 RepID=UPI0039E40985
MSTKMTMRLAAGAAAVALAMAGAVAMGTAAAAAPGPGQGDNPRTTGSLIIHKRVGVAEGTAGTGEVVPNPGGRPLPDVEFTIWRLGRTVAGSCQAIDLANTDHWQASPAIPTGTAPATTAAVTAAGFCLADAGTARTTGSQGDLTFGGLPLGLYYVQETDAPATVVARSAPFYVTVPLPLADDEWIYDVNVYPKNQELQGPVKTVAAPSGLVVGSTLSWTITQTVPPLNTGETYRSVSIWDRLPAGLEYAGTTSVSVNATALAAGANGYTVDPAGVTWSLGGAARSTLSAGDTITVVFTTRVTSVTATGRIANPGSVSTDPGYGSEFNGGRTPGETVPHSYWGALRVTKVDPNAAPLANAAFQVYPRTGAACAAEPPATGLVSTGTSGADGIVVWTPNAPAAASSPLGLWVANNDDGPLDPVPTKVYCVYETVVPAGYIGAGVQTVTITPGTDNTLSVPVTNTPRDTPELPRTGGQATLGMSIGGLVLVAAGAVVIVVSRRRHGAS